MFFVLFADYRPWHLEPSILQFYCGSLQVLNRRYSPDLGQVESRAFWVESAKLQNMVRTVSRTEWNEEGVMHLHPRAGLVGLGKRDETSNEPL